MIKILDYLHDKFGFGSSFVDLPDDKKKSRNCIFQFLLLGPALILFFVPFILRPTIFSGDEPHYLMVANGVLKNHTLDLRKVYDQHAAGSNMAGKPFIGVNLDHHTALVDMGVFPHKTLGQWHQFFSEDYRKEWNLPVLPDPPRVYAEYSVRALGWPLLIAVGVGVLGLDAEMVSKLLSHCCVLLAGFFVALSLRKLHCRGEIALFGAVTLVLGSSYWIFANTAMAESALGACLACVLYAMIAGYGFILGIALALGAWMKFQFLAPSMVFFLIGMILIPRGKRFPLLLSFILGIGGYFLFNILCYGQIQPPMVLRSGNPMKAFSYFFLNPSTSILLRNPWILSLLILPFIQRAILPRRLALILGVMLGVLIVLPLSVGYFDGGYGYPCRLILPTLIIFAILLGLILQSEGRIVTILILMLVALSILINLVAAISDPRLTWSPTWLWMLAFFRHLS